LVVFALLHFALIAARARIEPIGWADVVVLGAAPAALAISLAVLAWKHQGSRSWALSAAGLVVLLVAMAASHFAAVIF
jgi:hypothetical protein